MLFLLVSIGQSRPGDDGHAMTEELELEQQVATWSLLDRSHRWAILWLAVVAPLVIWILDFGLLSNSTRNLSSLARCG